MAEEKNDAANLSRSPVKGSSHTQTEPLIELTKSSAIHYDMLCSFISLVVPWREHVQRIREGLKSRIRSLVTQRAGLDEMAVDDLATSTQLQ
nr:ABC transporter permease [Nitrospira sp.]